MSARFLEHRGPDLVHRVPRRDQGTVCLVPLRDLEDASFMIPISSSGEGDPAYQGPPEKLSTGTNRQRKEDSRDERRLMTRECVHSLRQRWIKRREKSRYSAAAPCRAFPTNLSKSQQR